MNLFEHISYRMNSHKKNIIMICIDGCRSDRAKNSKIFTDYLPGTNFCSQSITYAPYTNSSIYAVFSGAYGNRNGCFSYWHSLKFKNDKFKTITKYLVEQNYYTHADVHSKLALPISEFGKFEIYDEKSSDLISRHKNLIKLMKMKFSKGKNFFLYLHYEKIHTGIVNSVLKSYTNFSEEYFKNKDKNEKRYNKLFKESEVYLKNILDEINFQGLTTDTLIIIFSDHGISLGEKVGERAYGAFCYDYTIKTFCSFIATEFQSQFITQQIRHVDFLPSIIDFLGIPFDEKFSHFDGKSIIPLFYNKKIPEEIAFTETANPLLEKMPPKKPNTKSVRTSNWKLIFNEYDDTKELYNLKDDPEELNNLIGTGLEIENKLWNEFLNLQQK